MSSDEKKPPIQLTRSELLTKVRAWEYAVDAGVPDNELPECPTIVALGGRRMHYLGFRWLDEGKARGDEPYVVPS